MLTSRPGSLLHKHMRNTIRQTLSAASEQLQQCSDSARADAEILLSFILACDRSFFHTWPELELEDAQAQEFKELLQRRINGEPIAHITGHRSFWDFDLKVSADTLIPRPETELLIEHALKKIPTDSTNNILDLGTGTGAIALAIAYERPLSKVMAIEQSPAALNIAEQNKELLKLSNLTLLSGDWFTPLNEQMFNIIISNPPYISDNDPHLLQGDVRFEPRTALAAGADGLDDLRFITSHAQKHLITEGWLMLEHGYNQADQVHDLLAQNNYKNIQQFNDLGNQPRVSIGQK